MNKNSNNLRSSVIFSKFMLGLGSGKKIAYIAVITALSVICNMFLEIKFMDNQFSFTIVMAVLSGIILGPICGFFSSFLSDFIGFIFNSWGMLYMPWVGFSMAFVSLIAGFVLNNLRLDFKGGFYIKIALVCMLTFLICTVAINSTGFYLYNRYVVGFSPSLIAYVDQKFGGNSNYFIYLFYRLIFKGQIWNNVVNYVLLFIFLPLMKGIKQLKIFFD